MNAKVVLKHGSKEVPSLKAAESSTYWDFIQAIRSARMGSRETAPKL